MTTRFLLLATALLTVNYPVRSVNLKQPGPPFQIGARAFVCLPPDISSAQQDGWVTIKTEAGILFIWNARGGRS